MENLIASASQYGALGLVSLASFWYINKLNTQNVESDKNHIQNLLDLNKQVLGVVEKNTEAFFELKEAIKQK